LIAFYGTSLYQDLMHTEFNGMPWDGDNSNCCGKPPPLAFVKNVKTPTLFIHGERDMMCDQRGRADVHSAGGGAELKQKFLRYPREGHGLREPLHRVDQINRLPTYRLV